MVEMDETDDRGGGGLVEFTESGEEGLIPAGWVWTVFKVYCREGYELDTIELNGVAGTIIDLTDMNIDKLYTFFDELKLSKEKEEICSVQCCHNYIFVSICC